MHISKIEVFGFKSFAKKQTVLFNSGITGIVGPNGCGKTNIVDAIRWVLGEQRVSRLRGSKMEDVIDVISKGAAQSWQMENRYKTMIDDKFDFGFAVDWMRKDLKIAMDEAKNNGSLLPITEIIDKYYGEVQELGGKRWDTSSLIKRFRK